MLLFVILLLGSASADLCPSRWAGPRDCGEVTDKEKCPKFFAWINGTGKPCQWDDQSNIVVVGIKTKVFVAPLRSPDIAKVPTSLLRFSFYNLLNSLERVSLIRE
jgi:hypothetical protein